MITIPMIWDAWLLQSIVLSFGLTTIDAATKSLMIAWFVCCFDVAFIIDSLTRGLHKARAICEGTKKIHIRTNINGSSVMLFTLSSWLHVFSCVSLIPFHILFLWHMDRGVYYPIVCLMRIMWIYQARRSCFVYLNFDGLRKMKTTTSCRSRRRPSL